MQTLAVDIEETLRDMASEKRAAILLRFFKTGPGEYGEGDHFLGVANPEVRMVVKESWRTTSLSEAERLVKNQWHEVRLCGLLILVEKMQQAIKSRNEAAMLEIRDLYLSLHPYINNWDLVDLSAYKIIGKWEVLHPTDTLMDEWIRLSDDHLWQRRIAMISSWQIVRAGDYERVKDRARCLFTSRHDLLHKAGGWILREIYRFDSRCLETFVMENCHLMPSTMLSYAIEKCSPEMRTLIRQTRKERLGKG